LEDLIFYENACKRLKQWQKDPTDVANGVLLRKMMTPNTVDDKVRKQQLFAISLF
jgi:hypothetical protein